MKTIKILGPGCAKCKQTEAVIKEALIKFGIEAEVKKVEDIEEIMQYSVMSTPAVVVDDVVKLKGRIPTSSEIRQMLN